jgi:cytochrome c-type biogenesis protein CcmH
VCESLSRQLLLLLLLVFGASCTPTPAARGTVDDERWLEARLVAPCCWTQTLDVHESPLARELRGEIHDRLAAGQRPAAIEDDLVSRYGEGVRALPPGKDPRHLISLVGLALVLFGAVGMARLMRTWTRDVPRPVDRATRGARDLLDERLDEDLRDLNG